MPSATSRSPPATKAERAARTANARVAALGLCAQPEPNLAVRTLPSAPKRASVDENRDATARAAFWERRFNATRRRASARSVEITALRSKLTASTSTEITALSELQSLRADFAHLDTHHEHAQVHLQRTDVLCSGLSDQLARAQHALSQAQYTISVAESREKRKTERIRDLTRSLKAMRVRVARAATRKAVPLKPNVFHIKTGGSCICDEVRDTVTKLSLEGLGSKRVWPC
jgi:hypothetical protein